MNRKGVLLLGGAGFIGSTLCTRLAAIGRPVHAIVRQPCAIREPGCTFHVANLADPSLLASLRSECGTVVHLASTTTPGTSALRPTLELENLAPSLQLLEVLQQWDDTHLVFLSSGGTVYGNPVRNPVAEEAAQTPLSYHGAGKVALEAFLHAFRSSARPVTILRLSNAYGPGQHPDQGFGLIRTVLQHMLRGTAMEVWGDGLNVRDYLYIDDAVAAVVAAVNSPADRGTYNIGSGQGHTVNQVLEIAKGVCRSPLQVDYRPARSVDVREVVLDITLARAALGWRPSIDLEEGILRTWTWLKNHGAA
jgi:UDP-glucose 4-epimerase